MEEKQKNRLLAVRLWKEGRRGKKQDSAGKERKRDLLRMAWLLPGFLCLGLGTLGVILPILPTVPFYMATVFCFAKSSRKLHRWFLGTSLYQKHLESFVQEKSMTIKAKLTVAGTVTLVMAAGFLMMGSVPVGRLCLTAVWICHLLYFFLRIKTKKEERVPVWPLTEHEAEEI